jgi:hypothetical protein
MINKLLQFAVVTFLLVAVVIAFTSDESLSSGVGDYYSSAFMTFIFLYPMVAAVIVWEHISSRNLKCWSACAGLMVTLVFIWSIGSEPFTSGDLERWIEQTILLLYFFVLSSCLSSVFVRFFIRALGLLRFLIVKLKVFSRALPN